MVETMQKADVKSFNKPIEVRTFDKGKVELVKIGGATVGRAILQPGWKWSNSVKPIAKTNSCEAPHFQYHISGTLKVGMGDQYDNSKMTGFGTGSFLYVDPTMHHYAGASGETIIQIHGESPLAINYINPADDPSMKK